MVRWWSRMKGWLARFLGQRRWVELTAPQLQGPDGADLETVNGWHERGE